MRRPPDHTVVMKKITYRKHLSGLLRQHRRRAARQFVQRNRANRKFVIIINHHHDLRNLNSELDNIFSNNQYCFVLFHCIMLCYCYGSVSDQLGPSAFNNVFDLILI